MRLPTIQGVIRRRILANFRIDPEIMQRQLPTRFTPKLQCGYAVGGVCLIRLEHIRPRYMPEAVGLNSENAAHRVAVEWNDDGVQREGVFIFRRDTNSEINALLGGRVFPGEHHHASFQITESDSEIQFAMKSDDASTIVELNAKLAQTLPQGSVFANLAEASAFFEGGALGYSVTSDPGRLDGLKLVTQGWSVEPLKIARIYASYFDDGSRFPANSIQFDHALIMKDLAHEWHGADDLYV